MEEIQTYFRTISSFHLPVSFSSSIRAKGDTELSYFPFSVSIPLVFVLFGLSRAVFRLARIGDF